MDSYPAAEAVTFRFTREAFGELSNMCQGFPLQLDNFTIPSTEHLYQAYRFPEHPDFQTHVIEAPTPMESKRTAYRYIESTRPDWDSVKVEIMETCCLLKLMQHWDRMRDVLDSTCDYPIVEYSTRDTFWGASPQDYNGQRFFQGRNQLGKIWMSLRDRFPDVPTQVELPDTMRVLAGVQLSPYIHARDTEETYNLL
mgnify:CR=1 FL=1